MNDTTPSASQSEAASPNAESLFVCECDAWMRSACKGEAFFREYEGKRYCVLHYPNIDKVDAFRVSLNRKLEAKDFNFLGVWFPEEVDFHGFEFSAKADFDSATFSTDADFYGAKFNADADFGGTKFCADASFGSTAFGADVNFDQAMFSTNVRFNNTTFGAEANFSETTFSADAYFHSVTFNGVADFGGATFNAYALFSAATFRMYTDFIETKFNGVADFDAATFNTNAHFYNATFNAGTDFGKATFNTNVYFGKAMFKNYVNFAGSVEQKNFGETAWLDFQFVRIEKPDRIFFHTLNLKPHWFINCDCRKFEFTDCGWNHDLKQEVEGAIKAKISAPHRLLAITFRQLADNAEANHRYHEASNFRYNAFEARRVEKFGGFVPWRLDWWYWLASGYGERVGRAFVVFIILFALFAFGYTWTGFDQSGKSATASVPQAASQPDAIGKPLNWQDAFIYSFYVTILQKPKPEPLTRTAKVLVGLETVLGPAQAALLALAVRRRFMR